MVKRYLSLCTFDEARHRLYTSFEAPCRTETVPITRALGRVLSAPLYAKYSVPEVNLAAMDGIAVKSRDTIGASDQKPGCYTGLCPGKHRQCRSRFLRCRHHDRRYLARRGRRSRSEKPPPRGSTYGRPARISGKTGSSFPKATWCRHSTSAPLQPTGSGN